MKTVCEQDEPKLLQRPRKHHQEPTRSLGPIPPTVRIPVLLMVYCIEIPLVCPSHTRSNRVLKHQGPKCLETLAIHINRVSFAFDPIHLATQEVQRWQRLILYLTSQLHDFKPSQTNMTDDFIGNLHYNDCPMVVRMMSEI